MRDAGAAAIVNAVVSLCREPSLSVRVETAEQFRFLRSPQCASAQGYLFSHPLPHEGLRSFLAQALLPIAVSEPQYICVASIRKTPRENATRSPQAWSECYRSR
jgi:predicted signal transduction protein with EAL and GGDEF domain